MPKSKAGERGWGDGFGDGVDDYRRLVAEYRDNLRIVLDGWSGAAGQRAKGHHALS